MDTKLELDIELLPEGIFQAISNEQEEISVSGTSISEAIQKAIDLALKLKA